MLWNYQEQNKTKFTFTENAADAKSYNERDSKNKNEIKKGLLGTLLEPIEGRKLGTPLGIKKTKKCVLKGTSFEAKLSVQQLTKPTDNIIEVDKDLSKDWN